MVICKRKLIRYLGYKDVPHLTRIISIWSYLSKNREVDVPFYNDEIHLA